MSTSKSKKIFGDRRDDIAARCAEAGIKTEVVKFDDNEDDDPALGITWKNGEHVRELTFWEDESAAEFGGIDFTSLVPLGGYVAMMNKESGLIEATVRPVAGGMLRNFRTWEGIPGVEFELPNGSWSSTTKHEGDDESDSEDVGEAIQNGRWRLLLTDQRNQNSPITVEVSPPTAKLLTFFRNPPGGGRVASIKISGSAANNHDTSLQLLESFTASFFFDLDVSYGLSLELMHDRNSRDGRVPRIRRPAPSEKLPSLPTRRYPKAAVDLYIYGRSAHRMPLLEYLAYYQTIEYFYPSFWQAKIMTRVRQHLEDPRFDTDSDADISKLIALMAKRGQRGTTEREQIIATIEGSMTDEQLAEFIGTTPRRQDFFRSKDWVSDVQTLNLRADQRQGKSLANQVANRIYDIRCKIVHSKEDEPGTGRPILPASKEARRLEYDIGLIRLVAQKVLIAGSRGRIEY